MKNRDLRAEAELDLELARGVGEAVRERRTDLGWTQAELARRVETDRPLVSRLEKADRHVPTLATIRRYAQALQVPPSALLRALEDQTPEGRVQGVEAATWRDPRVFDTAAACGVPPTVVLRAALDAFFALDDGDQVEAIEGALEAWDHVAARRARDGR